MVLFSYGGNDPIPGFTCVSRDKNKQTKQVRVISYLTKEKNCQGWVWEKTQVQDTEAVSCTCRATKGTPLINALKSKTNKKVHKVK